jgi:EmrB/QacA subfamily drug resistance transporter
MSRFRLPTTVTAGIGPPSVVAPGLSAAQVAYAWSPVALRTSARIPLTTTDVGLRSERGPLLLALMLSTGLVAIDSTIIATAVPSIVKDIGGFSAFPWLFSIYLLAQAVTTPIYGKLADLFGRKPIMLLGIGFFLLGSIMCGFAWNIVVLIVFRAVQGLGAGAVFPMSITIVGDIYTVEERSRVQGYLASVWGISSVVGPTLGGVFSEYVSWRWIFFVNIPLCLAAATMIQRRFHEKVARSRPNIDYAGASVLTVGLTLVILGVLEGGQAWSWGSVQSVVILSVGAVLLIAFGFIEQRVSDPVLPLWVLRRRLLVTSSLASCGIGAVVLGLSSYIPTYVQGVLGTGPVIAGFALATLTMGWPVAASQAGKVYLRIGFRVCSLIGSSVVVVGAALLLLLGPSSPVVEVAAFCFVIGLGMGLSATPSLIAAQTSVGWTERGVVTGTNMFFRSMGSAVGVAVFGAIWHHSLENGSLSHSIHNVYIAVLVVAVATVCVIALMPRDRQSRQPASSGSAVASTGAGSAARADSASTPSASRTTPAP